MKERVIVVDDEPVVQKLVQRVLEKLDYETKICSGADEALEVLKNDSCMLVISDIRMPGKDGIYLAREIKKKHPGVQVIMLTASDRLDDAIMAMNAGAGCYLLKPLNVEDLSNAVKREIEKARIFLQDQNYKQWMITKMEEQKRLIWDVTIGAIESLIASLEAKDQYTRGHSQKVAAMCTGFAAFLGIRGTFAAHIAKAASLHDIGKIGVREATLLKPGKLSEKEYEHVKLHPVLGEKIVRPMIADEEILLAIRHHHERYDGKGYPDALEGERIPLAARIIALADSYDAMTSDRPYRKANAKGNAVANLRDCAGTQFDPDLAAKFCAYLDAQGGVNAAYTGGG